MPEQSEEAKKRIEEFKEGYGKLVDKFKCDFAQYPVWIPDGAGAFKTILQNTIVDITNSPVKRSFVTK